MAAVPVAMEYNGAGGPGQWPAAEYQFRLVSKNSGETVGLGREADIRVEFSGAPTPPSAPSSTASNSDLYTELMKLDDLRKKGIITEQEFDTQKAKLLAR